MSNLKTVPTESSVERLIEGVEDPARRGDCRTLLEMMSRVTGEPPRMWGPGMVGFGSYHYRYASGREGDWFLTGFAPRKADLTVYVMAGFARYEALLSRLGKHRTGKSCLYIKRLSDVSATVLEELVGESVETMRRTHS